MRDIFLDFDMPFEEWVRHIKWNQVMHSLRLYYLKWIDFVRIRKSSGGNTHVWVRFRCELSEMEHFAMRAFLWDDKDRVYNDLRRYFIYQGDMNKINRCFDVKVSDNRIAHAGQWIEVKLWGVA